MTRPTIPEFQDSARRAFSFLQTHFEFAEESIPTHENQFLNPCAVWFTNKHTGVVVEGINWGLNCRVAIGRTGRLTAFEDFDLGDLLTIRSNDHDSLRVSGQLAQLQYYADSLWAYGADVLRNDHSVFPVLAGIVEKRRAEFARQDRARGVR